MGTPDTALPATLDAATRARIASGALPLKAPAGAVLFRPGDPCRGFVLLRSGRARVDLIAEDGQALLLYRVEPGQACAITTSCLFAEEPYSAEATAETDCEGLMLPAALFTAAGRGKRGLPHLRAGRLRRAARRADGADRGPVLPQRRCAACRLPARPRAGDGGGDAAGNRLGHRHGAGGGEPPPRRLRQGRPGADGTRRGHAARCRRR